MSKQTKQDLAQELDALIDSPEMTSALAHAGGCYDSNFESLFCNIRDLKCFNRPDFIAGQCNQASRAMVTYFKEHHPDIECVTVTVGTQNNIFHMYNLLKLPDGDILILDMSAAQFFSKPLDALNGNRYFLGSRQEFKALVQSQQSKTWDFIQAEFPARNYKSLTHVDYTNRLHDYDRPHFSEHFRKAAGSLLDTDYFSMAWESTWGDQSKLLYKKDIASAIDLSSWHGELVISPEVCLLLPDPRCIEVPVCAYKFDV